MYLLTNPHTNLCGCYEISTKQMIRETGYNEDTVKALLNRMENVHGVIKYDPETKEVLIKKWGRYNWANSPKTKLGAKKVAETIKSDAFREYVIREIDTVSIPHRYHIDTSVSDSDSVSETVSDTGSAADSDSDDLDGPMPF